MVPSSSLAAPRIRLCVRVLSPCIAMCNVCCSARTLYTCLGYVLLLAAVPFVIPRCAHLKPVLHGCEQFVSDVQVLPDTCPKCRDKGVCPSRL